MSRPVRFDGARRSGQSRAGLFATRPGVAPNGAMLTVGHSNHEPEVFLRLLSAHGVSAVADVRSTPWSRRAPQFGKRALSRFLKERGVAYAFPGRELGARPDDSSCYENGRARYARLAGRPAFRSGVERVKNGVRKHRIAPMCVEREPLECHRTILVARALEAEGFDVAHIHADGSLEPHRGAVARLCASVGVGRDDMFRSAGEAEAEAFALQEARIAWRGSGRAAGVARRRP